jgi:hypothetical protein
MLLTSPLSSLKKVACFSYHFPLKEFRVGLDIRDATCAGKLEG